MPGDDVQEPIIDIKDIVDVAVAALTEDRHSGKLSEVTGPQLMTFADMADALSNAIGRQIRCLPITTVPSSFHASYGITLGSDPSLLSELRAAGANLAVLGAIILAGAFRQGMQRLSAFLGATAFLTSAFGRIVGMALDGMPSSGLIQAILIELIIGGFCAAPLWRGKPRTSVNEPLLGLPG